MFAKTVKPTPPQPSGSPAAPPSTTYAPSRVPMQAEEPPHAAPRIHPVAISVVGPDLILEGTMAGDVELHVEGAIRGDIHVTRLVVGQNAHVEGRVRAQTVEVHGRVIGDIEGQRVKLSESAYVQGDILHEQLSIEPGAYFQGVCRQPPMAAPSAPRVEAPAQAPFNWEKAS